MDKETLYNAEVKLLTTYCHNCLDNKMRNKIIMFLFKMTLLENAEELGLPKDVARYQQDILRLLGLGCSNCTHCNLINSSTEYHDYSTNEETCKTCENGYCTICK